MNLKRRHKITYQEYNKNMHYRTIYLMTNIADLQVNLNSPTALLIKMITHFKHITIEPQKRKENIFLSRGSIDDRRCKVNFLSDIIPK